MLVSYALFKKFVEVIYFQKIIVMGVTVLKAILRLAFIVSKIVA